MIYYGLNNTGVHISTRIMLCKFCFLNGMISKYLIAVLLNVSFFPTLYWLNRLVRGWLKLWPHGKKVLALISESARGFYMDLHVLFVPAWVSFYSPETYELGQLAILYYISSFLC